MDITNYSFKTSGLLSLMIIILGTSCEPNEEINVENEPTVALFETGDIAKSITQNWLNNSASRTSQIYQASNLLLLIDSVNQVGTYTIPNSEDLTETLTFTILDDSSVINPMRTKTTVLGDIAISNRYMTLEGELVMEIIDYENGDRQILNHIANNGRVTSSWWTKFSDCMGKLNSPFGNPVANIGFSYVANAATVGLYTPLSGVVCAGAGFGNYTTRNNDISCSCYVPSARSLLVNIGSRYNGFLNY